MKFNKNAISFDEAKKVSSNSTKIVNETIDYFHKLGKKVHIISASYGALIAVDQIAEYGATADSYFIVAGRLNMPEIVWTSFSNGNPMVFKDGVTPEPATIEEAGMGTGTEVGDRNMMRIAAGLGYKRYTELLAGKDLSKVTYITALQDMQVGVLNADEINFLENQKAKVILTNTGHEDAITAPKSLPVLRKLLASE